MATGEYYTSLAYDIRAASEFISHSIQAVCGALNDDFQEDMLSCPLTSYG